MEYLELKQNAKKSHVKDTLQEQYLKTILRRMNRGALEGTSADSVVTTLYLHHFSLLKEYPETTDRIIPIETVSSR